MPPKYKEPIPSTSNPRKKSPRVARTKGVSPAGNLTVSSTDNPTASSAVSFTDNPHSTADAGEPEQPNPIQLRGRPDPSKRTGPGYTEDIMESFDVDPNANTEIMSLEELEYHESQMKLLNEFLEVCGGRGPNEVIRETNHRLDVDWGLAQCGPKLCQCSSTKAS